MAGDFDGFSPQVFEWFAGLERENTRDYFARTRDFFEADIREALEAMLLELQAEFGGDVRVFRQHRDLRFSRDKSPYKTRTYGVVDRYYAELSSQGLYAGTGYHQLTPDQLDRYRAAVADDTTGPELESIVAATGLDIAGATLRTAPRGYPRDHPRIDLLRRKALIAGRRIPGAAGIARDAALHHAASTWRAAAPLNAWLDAHVGQS